MGRLNNALVLALQTLYHFFGRLTGPQAVHQIGQPALVVHRHREGHLARRLLPSAAGVGLDPGDEFHREAEEVDALLARNGDLGRLIQALVISEE